MLVGEERTKRTANSGLPMLRSTSYTSCRCRRDKDRCGQLCRRARPAALCPPRPRPPCAPAPARDACGVGRLLPCRPSTWSRDRARRSGAERSHRLAVEIASGAHGLRLTTLWRFDHLHQVQIPDGLFLEALHHGFEHVERLALVLHQRIVLAVAAQSDAFAQVVHAEQVVFPLLVDARSA